MKFLILKPFHFAFASVLGSNIRLRILFSNTLSLDSSLNIRDHVSQPYSTTGNIIVLYILIFKFLERSLDDNNNNNKHGILGNILPLCAMLSNLHGNFNKLYFSTSQLKIE